MSSSLSFHGQWDRSIQGRTSIIEAKSKAYLIAQYELMAYNIVLEKNFIKMEVTFTVREITTFCTIKVTFE